MIIDQWIEKYEGDTKGYPTNKDFLGECLSLAKWYIKDMYKINPPASGCNGARCYWTNFPNPLGTVLRKVTNTPDLIPLKGWVAVWNDKVGGGYGHISIVLSATKDRFVSLDQNWKGKVAHRVTHNYNNVYGFLAPLKTTNDNMSDPLKECLKQHDKLVTDAVRKDSKVEDLKETIKDKNEELATKEKQVSAQKGLVSASKKDVELCSVELTNARLKIVELEKGKPVEAIKDPLRYAISLGVGAILTWAYTKYPVLGQLQPDMQGLAVILIGLLVKGLDKYQHESGSSLKLPF